MTHSEHFVHEQAACKELEIQKPVKNIAHAIHGYALRFLKYNSSPVPSHQEVPATPDRIADLGMMDISWDDHLTEVCIPTFFMFLNLLSCFCLPKPSPFDLLDACLVCFTLTLFAHKSLIMHPTFYLQESLFYAVPSAAMAMYRLSIESHIMQSEVIKIF